MHHIRFYQNIYVDLLLRVIDPGQKNCTLVRSGGVSAGRGNLQNTKKITGGVSAGRGNFQNTKKITGGKCSLAGLNTHVSKTL